MKNEKKITVKEENEYTVPMSEFVSVSEEDIIRTSAGLETSLEEDSDGEWEIRLLSQK